jgi:hypothetical protein
MTLWSDQDVMSGTTVEERNQPHAGGSKNMKKPLGRASTSWEVMVSRRTRVCEIRRAADLDQDELVEQNSPPHVGKGDSTHDDQGTDHEAL